jgi:hypothetical protein
MIQRAAQTLRNRSSEELLDDFEAQLRSRPGALLAGFFAAGFFAARLLRR